MDNTNKNILSFHIGHDSAVAYYLDGKYYNLQIEKVNNIRYSRLMQNKNYNIRGKSAGILEHLEDIIQTNNFDEILIPPMTYFQLDVQHPLYKGVVRSLIKRFSNDKTKQVVSCRHHESHAALGFYSSPFDKALVLTVDGGGDNEYFTISIADRENGIKQLASYQVNLGSMYAVGCSMVSEIEGPSYISYPGKGMGLVARGKNILPHLYTWFKKVYQNNMNEHPSLLYDREYKNKNGRFADHMRNNPTFVRFLEPMMRELKSKPDGPLRLTEGQLSYDVMFTTQKIFEDLFDSFTKEFIDEYNDLPVVLSGGCALNVINNERVKNMIAPRELFIPSAPDDSGLAIGYVIDRVRPKEPIDTHNICPSVYDLNTLEDLKSTREWKKVTNKQISKLLDEGKIIGFMRGPSESGPRALGFRSILCDPSYPNMKNILNNKVKHREWFRPFAPACKKEHADKYFDSSHFEHMEFMSFAVKVKQDAKDKIPAVVHVDDSARLQTVTKESNRYFYDLLTSFEKQTGKHVLLNTSLNSWGNPISNTVEDSIKILERTDMDYLVVDDILFSQNKS